VKLSKALFGASLLLLCCAVQGQAQTATVNWNKVDQVIDGFGASSANETLSAAQGEFFFSTGPGGLGLSLLRTGVPDDGSCAAINASCAGQVSDMQLAIEYGAKVWSSAWSPPASMKSNGIIICKNVSGDSSLSPSSYSSYAAYLANYVQSLSTLYGIGLYALSIQNEPDYCSSTYAGAIWNSADFDAFIKNNLGPTFAADGLGETLIMMPESSRWVTLESTATTTMSDPAAAAYVGIVAWHDYDDASSVTNPFASLGKKYWETEASGIKGAGPSLCGGCWDPSIADALLWAQIVDNRMAVANANAWHYWILINGANDNAGLTGPDGVTIPKRAYMLGNYSKFVRPGFYRIDATHTPQNGVLVSAYKNSSTGQLVIVAINQSSSNVFQEFTLSGATASTMTPWITSGSLNLAEQADVSLNSGSFTYNLPASSITTFVGSATTALVPPAKPAPPTSLAGTSR
jgi:glucuronoarabinoxylan endo-1,4-beta-xylanase